MASSYLREFWAYYTSARPLRLRSTYSVDETRQRLLALNSHKDVHVRFTWWRSELQMVATAHAGVGPRGGSPIIPEVRARLNDDQGCGLLVGELGLYGGVRRFLAIFLAILFFITVMPGAEMGFRAAGLFGIGFVIFMMVCAHRGARADFVVIAKRLAEATGAAVNVA